MDQTQSNIEVVDATLQAIVSGDNDEALKRIEDDARWEVSTFLPQGGWHDGHDAIRALFGAVRERFSNDYKHLGQTVYGTSDHVFAELTRTGTDADGPGAERVLLAFHLVMGRIRGVKEFAFEVKPRH